MFGYEFDKKSIYIVLAVLILVSMIGFTQKEMLDTLLILPGVIIAITFHEFAHAFVADKLGDRTPKSQNRLNLNPLNHIDPIGFVLLIFVHFGWGKPVEINPRNFTRNMSMEAGEALVSIAGPAMNLILAVIFTIIYFAIYRFAPVFATSQQGGIAMTVLYLIVLVNVGLCIFNLLPLPPLDGSKIFKKFLPYNLKMWFQNNEKILYLVFLVLWISGLAGRLISPAIQAVAEGLFKLIGMLFGFSM